MGAHSLALHCAAKPVGCEEVFDLEDRGWKGERTGERVGSGQQRWWRQQQQLLQEEA